MPQLPKLLDPVLQRLLRLAVTHQLVAHQLQKMAILPLLKTSGMCLDTYSFADLFLISTFHRFYGRRTVLNRLQQLA
jgi:hypothetical protein